MYFSADSTVSNLMDKGVGVSQLKMKNGCTV
jgi:hypothetical protein